MKIRISPTTLPKITAALLEAEGRATTRCLTAADVLNITKRAVKKLDALCLRKKDQVGAVVCYRMGLDLPNAYRYQPDYTYVVLERFSSGWFLTHVSRLGGSNKQAEAFNISLTPEQAEIARHRFSQQFIVQKVAA